MPTNNLFHIRGRSVGKFQILSLAAICILLFVASPRASADLPVCTPPGISLTTDASGDTGTGSVGTVPGSPAQDITEILVAEPNLGGGINRLAFTIKVADLTTLPPGGVWRVFFNVGATGYFVGAVNDAVSGIAAKQGYLGLAGQNLTYPAVGVTASGRGVIAFTLILRRMQGADRPDKGLGVAVILRYTLRLLTLDQFDRAATLMCALEMLRREPHNRLGSTRFALGLWVGKRAKRGLVRRH